MHKNRSINGISKKRNVYDFLTIIKLCTHDDNHSFSDSRSTQKQCHMWKHQNSNAHSTLTRDREKKEEKKTRDKI